MSAGQRAQQLVRWAALLKAGQQDTLRYEMHQAWLDAIREAERESRCNCDAGPSPAHEARCASATVPK